MTATWLADVLRAHGCAVNESLVPDWKQRGHTDGPAGPFVGVLGHHTAGSASGDLPSLAIVRDGRPDLAGPLANLMLSRAGVWVPIASGRCWHAGNADADARWPWVPISSASGGRRDGNGYLLGIEAESAGTGDWTPAQLAAYPRGVAALLAAIGVGPDRFIGHLEWAPSRKIDPAGWPGGMNGFRASISKPVAPSPEDFMATMSDQEKSDLMELVQVFLPGKSGRAAGPGWIRVDSTAAAVAKLLAKPGVSAADIAAAIPLDLAKQVTDELAKRLNAPAA